MINIIKKFFSFFKRLEDPIFVKTYSLIYRDENMPSPAALYKQKDKRTGGFIYYGICRTYKIYYASEPFEIDGQLVMTKIDCI